MLVSTSSMLYSVQSRFIFTRAAEREKEEREDMLYLSVDEGGGNNLSSSDSSSSSSSSLDGLSSSSSDGSSDGWGDPDPTWVVDENEEAMKREWREREKQKEMLRKRAEIKKRLKAERERRANALGALNAYHRKHHHHNGPAAAGAASGGGMSVVWDGEVGDEDHREEDMHDRKRDSLALGRARASSLSSDGSGSVLLLSGGLPQSGLLGLKSSASLVRKQPLATASSGSTTTSSSPPVPRRGPAASSSLEAPRLGKARALAASPLAASQSVWRPQPLVAPATAAAADSLSTSPCMVVSPDSSPSSSTSTSPSPSPRKATASSKHGSRRRHSRSMNSTTTANEPSPSSGQRGAEAFERPRAYSAGPQLPPSRDKPKRKGKKERKDKTEKKEKKEKTKEKKEKTKEKKESKREKSSTGKRNSKGARLVRALSGGKLTWTGGSTDHDRIKRESFTGVNPALLSDSAAQDNPYIAEYRRERNTPRGGWPATPTTTSQAHEAVDTGARLQAENEDDEKSECAAEAEKNEATRGASAVVREAEEEVAEKKRRGTDSPRNGGSGRRQKPNGSSSSAASQSSGSGVALAPRRGVTSTSADSTTSSVKPAIPVLSLGTMSAARVEPHPHQTEAEAEADTLGSEGSGSSNAGSGIGSRLGAITPRMVEGFRSIVKKLGKNTTDDRIDRPAGEENVYDDDGEESEEQLSYSGSGSGSDSSESEEVRQRRRIRKRKLEKKRSMSERSLHRSRSLSPTRRTRDLLVGDPQPTSSMTTRGKRSGSTLHRETSSRAAPRKGGSERQPRTDRSKAWKRTKGEISLTSGGSSPLARSPAVARAAKSSSSARTSPVASPRDAVQRGVGLRNSDSSSSSSSSSSSDLASSNERVERRGRTMARRAGDTWGNFLARLSPRTTPRPLHSAASSPNLTTAASSSSSTARGPVQRAAEDDKAAKASSRSAKKNKPTRTRSDDRIDWSKDRIHPSTSSSQLPEGSAGARSRSLSPVRRTDKVDRKGGKHKKRNH